MRRVARAILARRRPLSLAAILSLAATAIALLVVGSPVGGLAAATGALLLAVGSLSLETLAAVHRSEARVQSILSSLSELGSVVNRAANEAEIDRSAAAENLRGLELIRQQLDGLVRRQRAEDRWSLVIDDVPAWVTIAAKVALTDPEMTVGVDPWTVLTAAATKSDARNVQLLVIGGGATAVLCAALRPEATVWQIAESDDEVTAIRQRADLLSVSDRVHAASLPLQNRSAGPLSGAAFDGIAAFVRSSPDAIVVAGPAWRHGPGARLASLESVRDLVAGTATIVLARPTDARMAATVDRWKSLGLVTSIGDNGYTWSWSPERKDSAQ